MKLINNIKNIAIIILVIAFLFSVKKCSDNKKEAISAIKNAQDQTKYFKNKLGTETASKIVLEASNKLFKQEILKKDLELKKLTDEFSKIKSVVKYKTKIVIDSIPIYFTDSIPCVFERFGKYENKNFNFDWELNQNKFDFKNIEIPNETTIITGFKRKWIFGKKTLTTDIVHSNELIKTNNIQTIEIIVPKPFHETRLFNFGAGIVAGYFIFK